MKLLEGKTALIFGIANKRSIAWGIAQAFHQHGVQLGFSYAGPVLERRVAPLAEALEVSFVEPCDVTSDDEIDKVAAKAKDVFGEIDILVHSIGFANREDLGGLYYKTSREGYHTALDISAYSFTALARAFRSMIRPGGSLLTLTYLGGDRVAPLYNVMGVAKAALEASVRYLAYDLGPDKIRVNAISPGPIRTLAAAGVPGFKTMYRQFVEFAPLQENITIEDVGNAAVYLCSDLAAKTTGEILYVDSGYNILAIPAPRDMIE